MEENEIYLSVLGTGWSFPPEFSQASNSIVLVDDEKDIRQSLEILLSTQLGERVMRPDYGCDLSPYVFETINPSIRAQIKNIVERAILYHEPRIKVNNIELIVTDEDGTINIEIEYTINASNSRSNYVYPFYINEGTNISK